MAVKPRVVVDTNVLLSGLFWRGTPHLVLELAKEKYIKLYLPASVINETKRVIREIKPEGITLFDEFLKHYAAELKFKKKDFETNLEKAKKLLQDPSDTPILASLMSNPPDFFVSGDQDFLIHKVREISRLNILTSRAFLEECFILYGKKLSHNHPELHTKIMIHLTAEQT